MNALKVTGELKVGNVTISVSETATVNLVIISDEKLGEHGDLILNLSPMTAAHLAQMLQSAARDVGHALGKARR